MSPKKFLTAVRRRKNKDASHSAEGAFVVERRQHPRINVELPLDYSMMETKGTHGGMVADASEGGLLVYLKEEVEVGTQLKIEILFVKGLEFNSIKAMAEVVWSDLAARESFGEFRYGLQFQSFHEGDLDRLRNMLKEIGQTYGS